MPEEAGGNERHMVRSLLAVLSVCGIAIGIVAYLESLAGATIDDVLPWMMALGIGAVAQYILIIAREPLARHDRSFFRKGFARGMPKGVASCVNLFWFVALGHLIWFFVRSGHGVPVIKDGQYVVSNRGRILKVLTQSEYLALKAGELRLFAALMIACYVMPTLYWWFPRGQPKPS